MKKLQNAMAFVLEVTLKNNALLQRLILTSTNVDLSFLEGGGGGMKTSLTLKSLNSPYTRPVFPS